jgi:hypothetical protein
LPASGAASEVMFFQEGEDGRERERPYAISSCWLDGERITVTGATLTRNACRCSGARAYRSGA